MVLVSCSVIGCPIPQSIEHYVYSRSTKMVTIVCFLWLDELVLRHALIQSEDGSWQQCKNARPKIVTSFFRRSTFNGTHWRWKKGSDRHHVGFIKNSLSQSDKERQIQRQTHIVQMKCWAATLADKNIPTEGVSVDRDWMAAQLRGLKGRSSLRTLWSWRAWTTCRRWWCWRRQGSVPVMASGS